jgi:nucleoid DNA-binding protein
MKKDELALELARSAGIPAAEAADKVDAVVHDIMKKLRHGKPATLPGLGKLLPEQQQKVRYSGSKTSGSQQASRDKHSSGPVRGKR